MMTCLETLFEQVIFAQILLPHDFPLYQTYMHGYEPVQVAFYSTNFTLCYSQSKLKLYIRLYRLLLYRLNTRVWMSVLKCLLHTEYRFYLMLTAYYKHWMCLQQTECRHNYSYRSRSVDTECRSRTPPDCRSCPCGPSYFLYFSSWAGFLWATEERWS